MAIPSRTPPEFDISAANFTAAARDVGEVVALLSGGVRPDPDTLSRLSLSMRALQGFLIEEARQQGYRGEITGNPALTAAACEAALKRSPRATAPIGPLERDVARLERAAS